MAKVTLELEYDYDFILIGISCHARDYKFCWMVNKSLDLNFARQDSLSLKTKNMTCEFAHYTFFDEDKHLEYTLLSNKGANGFLLPEQKQADYLLKIEGGFSAFQATELINKIRNIEAVLTAFNIDIENLKSRQNLIL
ncbi:MAG: IPExxxVDY family protein [Bacteroidetes bacterium]|nr:IPExxxVDY family protein [Bacteroidota bacterium]HET6245461.1 IPExxxVDY family protein [Bacteroidia bacterium]